MQHSRSRSHSAYLQVPAPTSAPVDGQKIKVLLKEKVKVVVPLKVSPVLKGHNLCHIPKGKGMAEEKVSRAIKEKVLQRVLFLKERAIIPLHKALLYPP